MNPGVGLAQSAGMRHLLGLLLAAVLVLLLIGFGVTLRHGRGLRALELQAAAHVEEIMRAEEAHRLAYRGSDDSPPSVSLDELMAEGRLAGFQPVPSPGHASLHQRDGYLFRVELLPFAEDKGTRPRLGQRYRLWSWPAQREHVGLVLYYGSSDGYLVQGENGEAWGSDPNLPDRTPSQAIMDATGPQPTGDARRWRPLLSIREPASGQK